MLNYSSKIPFTSNLNSLPALFTTQRGLNEPRYASLPSIMRARKRQIELLELGHLVGKQDALDGIAFEVVVFQPLLAFARY